MIFRRNSCRSHRIKARLVAVAMLFAAHAAVASAQSYDETKGWIIEQLKQYMKEEVTPSKAPPSGRDSPNWVRSVYIFSGCTLYQVKYINSARVNKKYCPGCVDVDLQNYYALDIDVVPIASITSVGGGGTWFYVHTHNDAVKHYHFKHESVFDGSAYSSRNGMWARTDPFGLCSQMPKEKQKLSQYCRFADAPTAIDRLTRYLAGGQPTLTNSFKIDTRYRIEKESEIVQRFDRAFKHLAGESAKKGCKVVKSLF